MDMTIEEFAASMGWPVKAVEHFNEAAGADEMQEAELMESCKEVEQFIIEKG